MVACRAKVTSAVSTLKHYDSLYDNTGQINNICKWQTANEFNRSHFVTVPCKCTCTLGNLLAGDIHGFHTSVSYQQIFKINIFLPLNTKLMQILVKFENMGL